MKEVVDWAVTNIGPNVVKYTSDSSEMQQLLRQRRRRRGRRSGTASLGSNTSAARRTRPCSCRPTVYPANGYLWIPKGAPHPVLAQIFINWRLCKDVQFPNAWPIEHGPWSELSEGFLGPDYVDQVPDWFKADYCQVLPDPRPDQVELQADRLDGLQRGRQGVDGLLRPEDHRPVTDRSAVDARWARP